ncbi:hypothetical protein J6590_052745 [Homalodisca vitripennis]|nr:hypothetical protein J6590_052745 [Homalodisca vitripennis]
MLLDFGKATLVNHSIRELCAGCEGSVLGLQHHLEAALHSPWPVPDDWGKRLLDRLVVAGLRRASLVSVCRLQPSPPPPLPSPAESPSIIPRVPPSPTTPWKLP